MVGGLLVLTYSQKGGITRPGTPGFIVICLGSAMRTLSAAAE